MKKPVLIFLPMVAITLLLSCSAITTRTYIDRGATLGYSMTCDGIIDFNEFNEIAIPIRETTDLRSPRKAYLNKNGDTLIISTSSRSCSHILKSFSGSISISAPTLALRGDAGSPYYEMIRNAVEETSERYCSSINTDRDRPQRELILSELVPYCWDAFVANTVELELGTSKGINYLYIIDDDVYLWRAE